MNIEVSKDELAVLLDGLAMLPLARSYVLFNRLAGIVNAPPPAPEPPPEPPPESPRGDSDGT